MSARHDYTFASDNTAGICPEALAALNAANADTVPSYGDDPGTARAQQLMRDLFETDCETFFVFNGTAANALALAALCARHQSVLCHEVSHIDNDECGAPEFFTGGSKLLPLPGPRGKLTPATIERALTRGHGVHFPKPGALSLTQSTEHGTLYTPAEIRALADLVHARGLSVHMDGSRFANACAALSSESALERGSTQRPSVSSPDNSSFVIHNSSFATRHSPASPADLTWRAGIDVLCFGGTKNGLLTTEAVVFFNKTLARDFAYRVKQSGQLASKQRFASAQWIAILESGAWLRQAAHANAQTQKLAAALRTQPGVTLLLEPEVNAVFVQLAPPVAAAMLSHGWHFYPFIGEHGYRLMCSWTTTDAAIAAFIADLKSALNGKL
jgi:threonine aldolase